MADPGGRKTGEASPEVQAQHRRVRTEVGRVARDAVAPGSVHKLSYRPHDVLLVNLAGEFFAIANSCPHLGWDLSRGTLRDGCIVCPGHGWEIDLKTGAVVSHWVRYECARIYTVELEGDDVVVYDIPNVRLI